jgi:hypothetical protein
MQQSTKITLIVVGAVVALLLLILGIVTLVSAPTPLASAEGFEGPLATVWQGMVWMGYLLLACGAALTLFLVASVLRMLFGAFGQLAGGIDWLITRIRNTWQPAPPALETVLGVKNGKSFTLQDALQSATSKLKTANTEIESLRAELAAVVARTAHIEPPPPPPKPKTAEEIAAEQATVIADLQRKLAAMQQAQQAAKPIVPAPQPVATEVAS